MRSLQRILFVLLGISASAAVALGIYVAQPWGDNGAYQNATNYLMLGVVLLFSVSPYPGLAWLSRFFVRPAVSFAIFVVGASCIGVGGALAYYDATFVHIDAQNGLVFLFVPLYQWLASLFLFIICRILVWLLPSDRTGGG